MPAAQIKLWETLPPKQIVRRAENGSMVPQIQYIMGEEHRKLRRRLLDAGLISGIVSFLNQGVDQEFTIDNALKRCIGVSHEGKIEHLSPKFWLRALDISTYEEFSLSKESWGNLLIEIARGIGPFLECMCDDIHKQFFRSHVHYHESLGLFFELIRKLAGNKREAAEVLLEYDCLIDVVVQCLFWRTHRPDIMKELTLSDLEAIEGNARFVIDKFIIAVNGDGKVYDDRAKTFFKMMATTPIVSNAFDPKNEAIFLSNVATLMKSDSFYKLKSVLQTWYYDILMSSSWTDCIDKNVISSVIDLFASVRTCDVAVRVVEMTFNLLCKRTGEWIGDQGDLPVVAEDDERFAVAINSGMISACLTMLQTFVGRREYPELLDRVHNLFNLVKKETLCKSH